jgi:hypothetical protein
MCLKVPMLSRPERTLPAGFIAPVPSLASAAAAFLGERWLHEIKLSVL